MNFIKDSLSRIWFLVSCVLLVLAITHLVLDEFSEEKGEAIFAWLVMIEGMFLMGILIIYVTQMENIKRINAEKDKALATLKNRMAAIEAAGDGIGIADPQGNLVYINSALQRLHGLGQEEIARYLGAPWTQLYTENGRIEIEEYVLPLLREHGYWRGTSAVVRKGGGLIHAELSLTLLPDGSMIGTARDISHQKKMDAEKQQLEQQFFQAQKMEAIGRLAGGIAHDFNNILAAMSGYAEFLKEDLSKEGSGHKYADNILKAGQQAKTLVDQMLAFSRQKQGTREAMDLREPVLECLSMVNASLPRTIEITTDIAEGYACVDGNPTQIAQVVMNLCVNAKDAMSDDHGALLVTLKHVLPGQDDFEDLALRKDLPDGSQTPPIKIKEITPLHTALYLGEIAKDHDYFCLCVSDTGSGISKAIMEQMFEPFFTTKPVDKGTGLGLATVHGVVSSHHGALIVESILGGGTSFQIFFPASKARPAEHVLQQDGPVVSHGGRILLVEDQDEVREITKSMLVRSGYSVEICGTGLDALMLLQERGRDFDLVLTDHNMPKMTGLEMICQAHLLDADMPFILLSGYAQESLQDMMNAHPAIKAVIRKPVLRKVLEEKIAAVLLESRHSAAA